MKLRQMCTLEKVWTLVFHLEGFECNGRFSFGVTEKEADRARDALLDNAGKFKFLTFKTEDKYLVSIRLADIIFFNICFDAFSVKADELVQDFDENDLFDTFVYLKNGSPEGECLSFDPDADEELHVALRDIISLDGMAGCFTVLEDEDGEDVAFPNDRISLIKVIAE